MTEKQKEDIRRDLRGRSLEPGIHVKMIKGRPSEVERMMKAFYKQMQEEYIGFKVIQTSSGYLPYGIAMTITFEIEDINYPSWLR